MTGNKHQEVELKTKDGKKVMGDIITHNISASSRNTESSLMQHLAMLGRVHPSTVMKASTQLERTGALFQYMRQGHTETPPVPLSYYVALYRNDPVNRACIEAKVANIAMQGYRIRPRREMALVDQSVAPYAYERGDEPDKDEVRKVEEFLSLGMPENLFPELLGAMWMDLETTGMGFLEISRDARGKIDGIYPITASTVAILADDSGYLHTRGGKQTYYAKYDPNPKTRKRSVKVKAEKESASGGRGHDKELLFIHQSWGTKEQGIDGEITEDFMGLAEKKEAVIEVNELLMMKKATPHDTSYGEPDILSAVYDLLGSQSAVLFNLSYFDSSTVPRLAIIVEGGEISETIVNQIRNWMNEQTSTEILNQVLIIEVPDAEAKIRIEPLSVAQLSDAGFMEYRDQCDQHIMLAHRTPPSMIGLLTQINRATSFEANLKFLAGVVRPGQRRIEGRFNYIFEKELSVKDWVLDLNTPELISEKERAEFFEILIRRGVVSVNDVRRFYGFEPTLGGDEPFILAVGQGALPVKFIDEMVRKNLGAPDEDDERVTGGVKTPPTKAPIVQLPADKDDKNAIVLLTEAVAEMQPEEREMVGLFLEQLGFTPNAVNEVIGDDVPIDPAVKG